MRRMPAPECCVPMPSLTPHELGSLSKIPGYPKRRTRGGLIPLNLVPLLGRDLPLDEPFPPDVNPDIYGRIRPFVLDGFLTTYQMVGWSFSAARAGSMLWWACGSGKTLAALLWIASKTNPRERAVIVTRAPARSQWVREVEKYTTMKARALEGQTPCSPNDLGDEILVLSWETLKHWGPTLEAWGRNTGLAVVWDELHKGKSWKRTAKYLSSSGNVRYKSAGNRAAAAASLSRSACRRLGLTATPIRDRVSDLGPQLDLVEPGCWGSNWEFVHQYADAQEGQYGGIDTSGRSNVTELKARLSAVTHVVSRAEMAKALPPKRRELVYLSKEDQGKPAGFKREMKAAARRGAQALFEMRLLEASSRKRSWITDTAVESALAGQKVTIFTGRRKDCENLAADVQKKLKGEDVLVLTGHGGDSTQYRSDIVDQYAKRKKSAVFVGTTDAFGEAVDGLQHTDLVIFGLLPWTPGQVTQAEGRFSRHGSDRKVLIMYTIAQGTCDELVADTLLAKLQNVEFVLDDEDSGDVARTLGGDGDEDAIIASILAAAAGTQDFTFP